MASGWALTRRRRPAASSVASGNFCAPDWLTQLRQVDDVLPALTADPDTIRDAIKAVGEDTQVTGKRRQP
jgi:hypothetical protein